MSFQGLFRTAVLSAVVMGSGAAISAQTAKQDMKDAGHETKVSV